MVAPCYPEPPKSKAKRIYQGQRETFLNTTSYHKEQRLFYIGIFFIENRESWFEVISLPAEWYKYLVLTRGQGGESFDLISMNRGIQQKS